MTGHVELTANCEIKEWDANVYDEPADGPELGRATTRKTFHGDLEGTSVTEVLTVQADGGRGYVAIERFTGTIAGRRGTVVFQHGGIDDAGTLTSFGDVVPASGTAALTGLTGQIRYDHDEQHAGPVVKLTVTFR